MYPSMDGTLFELRPFRQSDYVALARVAGELDPTRRVTPEEYQRVTEGFFVPPYHMTRVVVEERAASRAVGFGTLNNDPESFDPATFWVTIEVDPEFHGQGIGRAVAAALEDEAGHRHAHRLWASVRSDSPRAVRFFNQQGYVARRRKWTARLSVDSATSPSNRADTLEAAGVTFLTAADLDLDDPRVLNELSELNNATSADEPRLSPYTPVTLDQFVLMDLKGPGCLLDAYFLARSGKRLVASSSVRRIIAEPDTLRQGWTGTLRPYRNRGIATELKRRVLEYARSRGFRFILTGNDSLNEPMLAINRAFGFERIAERIEGERIVRPH